MNEHILNGPFDIVDINLNDLLFSRKYFQDNSFLIPSEIYFKTETNALSLLQILRSAILNISIII